MSHLDIDETGKYKTNKCSAELFLYTLAKYGIDATESIKDGVKDRIIAGGQGCINYVQAIKELNLRINSQDDSSTNKSGRL